MKTTTLNTTEGLAAPGSYDSSRDYRAHIDNPEYALNLTKLAAIAELSNRSPAFYADINKRLALKQIARKIAHESN